MRIECRNIDDFLTNLRLEGREIYQRTVYADKSRKSLNRENTSFEVYFQVSAVISFPDGGQALLSAGEVCGVDRHSSGELEGGAAAAELYEVLDRFCAERDLILAPGMLGM